MCSRVVGAVLPRKTQKRFFCCKYVERFSHCFAYAFLFATYFFLIPEVGGGRREVGVTNTMESEGSILSLFLVLCRSES